MDVIIELFEATSSGDLEKVKEYKNIKKVINKLFPKKITDVKYEYLRNKHLLYVACENGHCNIARYLIEKGAKLERQTHIRERCRGPPMMAPYLRHHRTALHIAILNQHNDCIQLFLKTNNKEMVCSEGFNAKYTWIGKIIGSVWIHKYYPIHLAIFTLNVSLVHQLLDLGTDIELKESSIGATPFLSIFNKLNRGDIVGYDAADEFHDIDLLERSKSDGEMSATVTFTKEDKEKQREIISLLVDRGANIHAVDRKGRNAVHLACLKADIELLQQAIKLGIDPKIPDTKGNTGFHCIVKKFFKGRSAEIAKILEKAGVEIDAKNEEGYSALHLCVLSEKDRTECASVLMDNHADINLLDEKGVPPLAHALARHSRKQLVKSLLNHPKLDIDYRDKEGNTYFHFFALNNSRLDFAYELKDIGLDINATNDNNITPLHIAVMKRTSVVEDLMDNGASMNLVDSQGNTPTHLSLYETKQETLYKLVRAGADVNIPNNKGKTVFQLMSSKTRKELELL